jgi:hypothetical protein
MILLVVKLYSHLFVGSSSVHMADTLVEGSRQRRITLYNARVVVDSVDVVSRLEATFVCLVPHG